MTTKTAWLAGTSFYDMKCFLRGGAWPVGLPLILEREPANEYDANAVLVFLDAKALCDRHYDLPQEAEGIEHFKLGHIPAKDGTAAWLAPLMDAGKTPTARFEKHGPATGIQITIEIEE